MKLRDARMAVVWFLLRGHARREGKVDALLRENGEMTEAELRQQSGGVLKRWNVYSTLSFMVEEGAVAVREGETPHYASSPRRHYSLDPGDLRSWR